MLVVQREREREREREIFIRSILVLVPVFTSVSLFFAFLRERDYFFHLYKLLCSFFVGVSVFVVGSFFGSSSFVLSFGFV